MQNDRLYLVPTIPQVHPEGSSRRQVHEMPLVFDASHIFTFLQRTRQTTGQAVRVQGWVALQQLDQGGSPGIYVEIATSDEDLRVDVVMDEPSQKIDIVVPTRHTSAYPEPWVKMIAVIHVPRDGEIDELIVKATHLHIQLIEDLHLTTDRTVLSSVVGNIYSGITLRTPRPAGISFVPAPDSYQFESRSTKVTTTSGNIYGNWPLNDLLALAATSGDIKVSITPKGSAPIITEASLSLRTVSGDIRAAEPIFEWDEVTRWIPPRHYDVDVHSTSGDIRAALVYGGGDAGAAFHTVSGDISADLLPMVDWDARMPTTRLATAATSGDTEVCVLEPCWIGEDDGGPWSSNPAGGQALVHHQSTHQSMSGDISLFYPQSWEGELSAESTNGSLRAHGPRVRITGRSRGWPKRLYARRGDEQSSFIRAKTVSGDLDAAIGEEQ